MQQARYLNQDSDIYLLSDETAYQIFQSNHQEFLDQENIHLIGTHHIPMSDEHIKFYEVNKIEPSLMDGYWMYASERFFVLYDFMKLKNLINVIHLESDSMLYVEVSELIPLFEKCNSQLAAPFQSLKGCIPCFVFIKNKESLHFLLDHIISEMRNFKGLNPHLLLNDMQTLASFYVKFGSDFLTPLPTLMPEYSRNYAKRRSSFMADNATSLSFLSLYADEFSGYIFDAAGLGIFINGNDGRFSPNHGPGTIHSRSLFNPGFFSFFWGKDRKERTVPYLSFKGSQYRIANLHFHSKKPEEYSSFRKPLGKLPVRKNS